MAGLLRIHLEQISEESLSCSTRMSDNRGNPGCPHFLDPSRSKKMHHFGAG